MAQKEKRISINALEEAAKENCNNIITVQWNGIDVNIRKTIPLRDMLTFTDEIVKSCFLDDGSYIPEMFEPTVKAGLMVYYANFSLPSNIEKRYELIYTTGVADMIYERIDAVQLDEIVRAANMKIKYLCDTDVTNMRLAINRLLDTFGKTGEKMEEIFSGVSASDVRKLAQAVGEGGLDERKIVSAYIHEKKAEQESSAGDAQ